MWEKYFTNRREVSRIFTEKASSLSLVDCAECKGLTFAINIVSRLARHVKRIRLQVDSFSRNRMFVIIYDVTYLKVRL